MNKFLRNVNKQVILAQDTLILIGNTIIRIVKFVFKTFDKGADWLVSLEKSVDIAKLFSSLKKETVEKLERIPVKKKKLEKTKEKKVWTPQYTQVKKEKKKVIGHLILRILF